MFGRTKHLQKRIQTLEYALEEATKQIQELQTQLERCKRSRDEQIENVIAQHKAHEKTIAISNDRLSVITGIKRYLDTYFQQENKAQCQTKNPPQKTSPSSQDASEPSSPAS